MPVFAACGPAATARDPLGNLWVFETAHRGCWAAQSKHPQSKSATCWRRSLSHASLPDSPKWENASWAIPSTDVSTPLNIWPVQTTCCGSLAAYGAWTAPGRAFQSVRDRSTRHVLVYRTRGAGFSSRSAALFIRLAPFLWITRPFALPQHSHSLLDRDLAVCTPYEQQAFHSL